MNKSKEIDFADFMTEEELIKMEKKVKETSVSEVMNQSNSKKESKPTCLGKYGELNLQCESCDLYKPKSECYRAKWGDTPDNDDDCGVSSC